MMMRRNNNIYYIVGAIILVLIVLLLIIFNSNKKVNVTFRLNGESNIVLFQNEVFKDPLYIALDEKGNNISNYVKVNGNVNTMVVGNYRLYYILNYKGEEFKLIRTVMVLEDVMNNYEVRLNGEASLNVKVGSTYTDLGAYVYDTKNNSKVNLSLTTNNYVNTSQVGKYNVEYVLKVKNKEKKAVREVNVYDLIYSLQVTGSNNNYSISFDATSDNDYSYVLLPNGSTNASNKFSYPVTKNGEYKFIIYDKYGGMEEKSIVVNSFVTVTPVTPAFSCSGSVTNNGTMLTVSGNTFDGVTGYLWNIDGVRVQGGRIYSDSKAIKSASVTITVNGSNYQAYCSIVNNIVSTSVYKFVYDEFYQKPYMECNSYTASDRAKYEGILKEAVNKAGYGTRAGVVEAARFLVGGLPHKVKYLGPKTVDSRLGRYNKVGLNIGYSDGWGCSVSGWTQGMDCTNFVNWAFVQAGLKLTGVYSTSNTYNTTSVVNKLRVGDFMLTPAGSDVVDRTFTHVGIIIGIDSNYIYVAEATTGSVNAIVTTKWDKNNMPTRGKFSVSRLYTYPSEGNVTNMWNS